MKETNYLEKIKTAHDYLCEHTNFRPELALILGSGWGAIGEQIEEAVHIPFSEIPYLPVSSVKGHKGQFIFGKWKGKTVVVLQGRVHYYEGYSMQQITFPVRVFQLMGVKAMIVTNACGGINPELYPGAILLLSDHINLMGDNPLRGKHYESLGPRFPDMAKGYDPKLLKAAQKVAAELEIEVFSGVYAAVSGPSYESAAEVNYLRIIGADAVGMSTVPEVIVAVQGGMKALGISCVTDMPSEDSDEEVTHELVIEVANKARPKLIRLVSGIVEQIDL